MVQNSTETERVRRTYSARGQRSQVMMTFRLDLDLKDWLQQQPNKGRYINGLVRHDKEEKEGR